MKKYLFILSFILGGLGVFAQSDSPEAPEFVSASVVPGSSPAEVVLTWEPSVSEDAGGYIIYRVNDLNVTTYLDSVPDRYTTTYTDHTSEANGKSETYRLATYDITETKISLLTPPHKTIYAFPYYDVCNIEVKLDWSAYFGWDNVKAYHIYKKQFDEFFLMATVSGIETDYLDTDLNPDHQYCYYVQAVRMDNSLANSNQTCVYTSNHEPPTYMNANFATVEENDIWVEFSVDTTAELSRFHLQRAIDSPVNFEHIYTFDEITSTYTYVDKKVDPSNHRYFYKLESVDPCDMVSGESNLASNIILKVGYDAELNHDLEWHRYEDWLGEVQAYEIWSNYGGEGDNLVYDIGGSQYEYSVNITDYVMDKHDIEARVPLEYCYYIKAKEDPETNPLLKGGVSKSNKVCVAHEPRVFIPNAFVPNSHRTENTIFKPKTSFIDVDSYEFRIFNRWGEEVFFSDDQTVGWDGESGKQAAMPGQYLYTVKYMDSKGKKYERFGQVILIRE